MSTPKLAPAPAAPRVSVVMPVYNVAEYVGEAIASVLAQSCADFELIIVDDGGSDRSLAICRSFADPRIRIISQPNRGLAGARNTGIAAARADYIALLDGDDRWHPDKLALHIIHLDANPDLGVSFCASRFIDGQGRGLRLGQFPPLDHISAALIFCRNPIGNGSAPVLRRRALETVCFSTAQEPDRLCWFDESMRQSEDIEMWLRLALVGGVSFAGIAQPLTEYRLGHGGLSANIMRQHQTWEDMVARIRRHSPGFVARHEARARAYQLRYLARRAVQLGDARTALGFWSRACRSSVRPLIEEPVRSLLTLGAALVARGLGPAQFAGLMRTVAGGELVG